MLWSSTIECLCDLTSRSIFSPISDLERNFKGKSEEKCSGIFSAIATQENSIRDKRWESNYYGIFGKYGHFPVCCL